MKLQFLWKPAIVVCFSFICINCASHKEAISPEQQAQFEKVENWVNKKQFTIVADWANPLNGNQVNFYGNRYNLSNLLPPGSGGSRVNLIGNPNALTINKDSVVAYLPYYGEVQVVKNYGGRGGITFEGVPENYTVDKTPADGQINIKFDMKDESERFQVAIKLYSNRQAHITLNSAYRHSISYDGQVMEIKDDKDLAKK